MDSFYDALNIQLKGSLVFMPWRTLEAERGHSVAGLRAPQAGPRSSRSVGLRSRAESTAWAEKPLPLIIPEAPDGVEIMVNPSQ